MLSSRRLFILERCFCPRQVTKAFSPLLGTALLFIGVIGFCTLAIAQAEIKLGGRRIVGGEKAEIVDYPWQVALIIKQSSGSYLCGGSILAKQWVVTAAHCFEQTSAPDSVVAKIGVTRYLTEGTWIRADKLAIHEAYKFDGEYHDIALVRLKTTEQGQVIPPVDARVELQVGLPLEVTGWGATTDDGTPSNHLLKARVPYVDLAECNNPDAYNGRITADKMCAGHKDGGVDACQGDSGGPLIWRSADGPFLVGIVSSGEGCAKRLRYGVYTGVSSYRSWINQTLLKNQN